MIDISKLTESDVGRNVTYHREFCRVEHGKLSSWNEKFVFVRFKGPNGEACEPADVTFDFMTAEEAERAYDEAQEEPLSSEGIEEIVAYVIGASTSATGPCVVLPFPDDGSNPPPLDPTVDERNQLNDMINGYEADHYPCAVCGKVMHVEEMICPDHHEDPEKLVCSEDCADSWNDQESEAMFG